VKNTVNFREKVKKNLANTLGNNCEFDENKQQVNDVASMDEPLNELKESQQQFVNMLHFAQSLVTFTKKIVSVLKKGQSVGKSSELGQEYKKLVAQSITSSPLLLADIQITIDSLIANLGATASVKVKRFYIGKGSTALTAAVVYIENLAKKDIIDHSVLTPLMLKVNENLGTVKKISEYLCSKYIVSSDTSIETDFCKVVEAVKAGKTVLLLEKVPDFIIINTSGGGSYRAISDPVNETAIQGSREGFVENLDINISMLLRMVKDENLTVENFTVGKRSDTRLSLVYIKDIADVDVLAILRKRIAAVTIDFVTAASMVIQLIEDKDYSPFPRAFTTERPDRVTANIMEGKIAILLDGSPTVLTVPAVLWEFFYAVEDYYDNVVMGSVLRLLRMAAALVVVVLSSLYLTLVKFSSELIPVDFIVPIVRSRSGIPLTPFLEILVLGVIVEFLREGGLRLPSKIAQTISIVGGIIIGDAVVQAKIVSPTTLLTVGITVVSSFLIPSQQMSWCLRGLGFIFLIMANFMGLFGISASLIFLLIHLFSLNSFGVPYFTFYGADFKDTFIRGPLNKMRKRPEIIPNNDPIRQNKNSS